MNLKPLTTRQLEFLRSLSASPNIPVGTRVATIIAVKDAGCVVTRVADGKVSYLLLTAEGASRLAAWR